MEIIINYLPLFGILALIFVFWKNSWVTKQDEGDEKMSRIAKNIADGAMSFLKAEYKLLSIFVLAVAILLFFKGNAEVDSNGLVAVSFIVGAICSGLAGFIGMKVATKANLVHPILKRCDGGNYNIKLGTDEKNIAYLAPNGEIIKFTEDQWKKIRHYKYWIPPCSYHIVPILAKISCSQ